MSCCRVGEWCVFFRLMGVPLARIIRSLRGCLCIFRKRALHSSCFKEATRKVYKLFLKVFSSRCDFLRDLLGFCLRISDLVLWRLWKSKEKYGGDVVRMGESGENVVEIAWSSVNLPSKFLFLRVKPGCWGEKSRFREWKTLFFVLERSWIEIQKMCITFCFIVE